MMIGRANSGFEPGPLVLEANALWIVSQLLVNAI